MIWIIFGIVAVIIIFIISKIIGRHALSATFIATYNRTVSQTKNKEEGLRQAISVFTYREPFTILDHSDVDYLSKLFSNLEDPTILSQAFQEAELRRDASRLKDRKQMQRFLECVINHDKSKK
jgi:hypothetical protein